MQSEIVIDIQGLATKFGSHVVHQDLDLQIQKGEILGIIGGSGAGKTTLLREILMLQPVSAGSIKVFGEEIVNCSMRQRLATSQRWGMMFQQGALFSSLSVLENVCFPLHEFSKLKRNIMYEMGLLKLKMAQFPLDSANKYPAELSGGMLKRAALARAMIMDPELLFLDEPTAGLDPESAGALDELVLNLQSTLGLTIVVITHDLDTLWRVTDRVAFLGEQKVLAVQPMADLQQNKHPLIQEYFSGPRSQVARRIHENNTASEEEAKDSGGEQI